MQPRLRREWNRTKLAWQSGSERLVQTTLRIGGIMSERWVEEARREWERLSKIDPQAGEWVEVARAAQRRVTCSPHCEKKAGSCTNTRSCIEYEITASGDLRVIRSFESPSDCPQDGLLTRLFCVIGGLFARLS